MRAVTTIFLTNSLAAILDHIERTADLNPELPGVLEFKETLLKRIEQLRNENDPCVPAKATEPHERGGFTKLPGK